MTKAVVHHTGQVVWRPPAMYKSTCEIDVRWFPFDVQECTMKFGSWTYDGLEVDLKQVRRLCNASETADSHICAGHQPPSGDSGESSPLLLASRSLPSDANPDVPATVNSSALLEVGIDMSEFYPSVEWDILAVPAAYHAQHFTGLDAPYPDISFKVRMRRKTLFYTVNLILPVLGNAFLTLLVFCLPSDSGEKVTLSISVLVSLTVFFLLLAETIPPTSLAVPLLGKYLLFTMVLVSSSICVTVGVLNVHFRTPSTHELKPWMRWLFIEKMAAFLCMKRPSAKHLQEQLQGKRGLPITSPTEALAFDIFVQLNGRLHRHISRTKTKVWVCPEPICPESRPSPTGVGEFVRSVEQRLVDHATNRLLALLHSRHQSVRQTERQSQKQAALLASERSVPEESLLYPSLTPV